PDRRVGAEPQPVPNWYGPGTPSSRRHTSYPLATEGYAWMRWTDRTSMPHRRCIASAWRAHAAGWAQPPRDERKTRATAPPVPHDASPDRASRLYSGVHGPASARYHAGVPRQCPVLRPGPGGRSPLSARRAAIG